MRPSGFRAWSTGRFGGHRVLHHEIRHPDQELLDLMGAIGGQIGQFIERKRAEDALRRAQAELTDVNAGGDAGGADGGRSRTRSISRWRRWGTTRGRASARKEWLDVNETVREVLALAQREVRGNRVGLQTDLREGLPAVGGEPDPGAAGCAQSAEERDRSAEPGERGPSRGVGGDGAGDPRREVGRFRPRFSKNAERDGPERSCRRSANAETWHGQRGAEPR
jgi:hypothetical protein